MSSAHSPSFLSLHLHHSSFSNLSIASSTSQRILQPFFCFSYVTGSSLTSPGELPMKSISPLDSGMVMNSAHSPSFLLLHLHHNSFSNPSITLPTSQLILQPFCCFIYVTAHSPTLPLLHLHQSSFSNPSFASPTSQALQSELILQPFCHFTYITTHFPTLPSLYLHHSSFSSPSVASPMSQFILQPFFCFSYVTSSSLNSPGELPMMRSKALTEIVHTACVLILCIGFCG